MKLVEGIVHVEALKVDPNAGRRRLDLGHQIDQPPLSALFVVRRYSIRKNPPVTVVGTAVAARIRPVVAPAAGARVVDLAADLRLQPLDVTTFTLSSSFQQRR